jgi:hypothetical protein
VRPGIPPPLRAAALLLPAPSSAGSWGAA